MRIKIAIRLRLHPPKRRSALARLKARLYYRRNRARIRMQRRRYLRTHSSQLKRRKQFQRFKPTWFRKPRFIKHIQHAKFKIRTPTKRSRSSPISHPFKPINRRMPKHTFH